MLESGFTVLPHRINFKLLVLYTATFLNVSSSFVDATYLGTFTNMIEENNLRVKAYKTLKRISSIILHVTTLH